MMCSNQRFQKPIALIIMGVSGSGKTTIGLALENALGWAFFDGDDFHPPENLKKMTSGIPLNDHDRAPWLERLQHLISDQLQDGNSILIACSALKRHYRQVLKGGRSDVIFIYLKGDYQIIKARMQARSRHYMKPGMLRSQFETLEEPINAMVINIDQPISQIVNKIIENLKLVDDYLYNHWC
jgi:gluconokinase